MSGYDWVTLAFGAVVTAAALWTTWLSPAAKARKQALKLQLQFHHDWNGAPERIGIAGEVISPAVPGVMERLAGVEKKLQAPILNGRGNDLLDTVGTLQRDVKRIDGRTKRHGQHMREMDQRIENRLAEQIVTIAEGLSDPVHPSR